MKQIRNWMNALMALCLAAGGVACDRGTPAGATPAPAGSTAGGHDPAVTPPTTAEAAKVPATSGTTGPSDGSTAIGGMVAHDKGGTGGTGGGTAAPTGGDGSPGAAASAASAPK